MKPTMDSPKLIVLTVVLAALAAVIVAQVTRLVPATQQPAYASEVKIVVEGGKRVITANGIPEHAVGRFPNAGNPNAIRPQNYKFEVPLKPTPATRQARGALFGVAVNGVPFDPGTAELWNNDFAWHYEALSGQIANGRGLGVDANFAHVQPNGAYHYHGLPMGLLAKLDYKNKMAIVGWAADGYPVYGNYGTTDPNDPKSPMRKLTSSYRMKTGTRPDGPGGAYDGSFASDFEYVKGAGDLDGFNGRTGVTPDFPAGTYYYVLTDTFPFIPRQLKGQVDPSFLKREGPGGPGGGPGGPGGPGQGGPGRPGFGGPGGPMGPPPGLVPADALGEYLQLSAEQKVRLATYKKAVAALRDAGVMPHLVEPLKLTSGQIERLGKGEKPDQVLTQEQRRIADGGRGPGGG
ncbi:MAG: YHYH protein [Fimbriimonadaceae bacterium]|nr:YHYH protein [Fimbriimonadaceae bacterium]